MTPTELSALGKRRAESLGLQSRKVTYEHDQEDVGYQGRYSGQVFDAHDIHALLGAGAIAFGAYDGGPLHYPWSGNKCDADTHSALLIGIKPLKVEHEERELIVEMVKFLERIIDVNDCAERDWLKRAKALLDGGG